jgi:hypothetical protein
VDGKRRWTGLYIVRTSWKGFVAAEEVEQVTRLLPACFTLVFAAKTTDGHQRFHDGNARERESCLGLHAHAISSV